MTKGKDHMTKGEDHMTKGKDHMTKGKDHMTKGEDHVTMHIHITYLSGVTVNEWFEEAHNKLADITSVLLWHLKEQWTQSC